MTSSKRQFSNTSNAEMPSLGQWGVLQSTLGIPGDLKRSETTLPSRVVLDDEQAWPGAYPLGWYRHVVEYAEWLRDNHGAELELKPRRKGLDPHHSMVLEIDGLLGVINLNDQGLAVGPPFGGMGFIFLKQCHTLFEHHQKYFSWPTHTQLSYRDLEELRQKTKVPEQGNGKINARMFIHTSDRRQALRDRRKYAQAALVKRYGDRVECEVITGNRKQYAEELVSASCTVHIPGGYPHSWDRTPALGFALGALMVMPTITPLVGWERPRPGYHYLDIWDDFSNMYAVVDLALDNPQAMHQTRLHAKRFWEENCAPLQHWRRVKWAVETARNL